MFRGQLKPSLNDVAADATSGVTAAVVSQISWYDVAAPEFQQDALTLTGSATSTTSPVAA